MEYLVPTQHDQRPDLTLVYLVIHGKLVPPDDTIPPMLPTHLSIVTAHEDDEPSKEEVSA